MYTPTTTQDTISSHTALRTHAHTHTHRSKETNNLHGAELCTSGRLLGKPPFFVETVGASALPVSVPQEKLETDLPVPLAKLM